MGSPPTLETLPSELILHTLSFLPLDAIASFSQTCVFFAELVYGDSDGSLWKTLYLASFDDPRTDAWNLRPPPSLDGSARFKRLALEKQDLRYRWREGARRSVTALREWKAGRMDLVRAEAAEVDLNYRALLDLLLTAPPAGTPSLNLPKLASALPSSLPTSLHMLPDQTQPIYHQLLAHLIPLPLPKISRTYEIVLNEARQVVYSLATARGSLENGGGHIDWKIVHALNIVQHWNMTRGMEGKVWDEEETDFAPWPWRVEHCRPTPPREETWTSDESVDWDWAGIAGGEWVGCYSFIDFSDYITFNHPELTRQRGTPSLMGVEEAVGDLMHLNLVPTCARPSTSSSTLPRIHFSGTSNSPVQSEVRGNARLTSDNPPQVRVTYVISYGGSEKWRLEGMQMGGIGGKRGIVGIWSEAHPGPHSPSGPFYFWKKEVASEEEEDRGSDR